jgi:hypothetical protein
MQKHLEVAGGSPQLPIPKITIKSGGAHLHSGNTAVFGAPPVDSTHAISINLMDIPADLFQPQYDLKVELLRWRGRHSRRTASGSYEKLSGWVHPAHWDGATTISGTSVRGGSHSGRVFDSIAGITSQPNARPTEDSLVGLTPNATINFRVARAFGAWFRHVKHVDQTGNAISLLAYCKGGGAWEGQGGFMGVSSHMQFGRFAFRYTIVDPTDSRRRISGPASQVVMIGTRDRGNIVNTGIFPFPQKVVNPAANANVFPQVLIARFADSVPNLR